MATDFSPPSQRALRFALSLARRFKSKIFLTHIIPNDVPIPHPAHELDLARHRAAQAEMQNLMRSLPADMVSSMVLIEEGPLWVCLEKLIHQHEIDLLVAGTRGCGSRPEPFLGSGAEQIFRHATCPVLTIGPATEENKFSQIKFTNVLFVTDFSPGAERAGMFALSFARDWNAHLIFLHIVEDPEVLGPPTLDHLRQIHLQRMRHFFQVHHGTGVSADFCIRFGNAADEILNGAREKRVDLIVLGAKPTTDWAGHVPLSTAYNVVAKAQCPVLSVRALA
jgi:nucleotide-binding universal stress UspA family protein